MTEAVKRQVIVFTHDVYFLCLLIDAAKRQKVDLLAQSIEQREPGYGVPQAELPFEGMNTKARVGFLKNMQQRIAAVHSRGDEPEFRRLTGDAYRLLRLAWERAVEEGLLRQVVLRFRKGVETQRLAEVAVEDADYATVEAAMSNCSNHAHDPAVLAGASVPEPLELLADINALDVWRVAVDDRSKITSKKRKSS